MQSKGYASNGVYHANLDAKDTQTVWWAEPVRLSKDGISSILGFALELCPAVIHHSHYENNNCQPRGQTVEWIVWRRLQWNYEDVKIWVCL